MGGPGAALLGVGFRDGGLLVVRDHHLLPVLGEDRLRRRVIDSERLCGLIEGGSDGLAIDFIKAL